jgi:hypothetical protein
VSAEEGRLKVAVKELFRGELKVGTGLIKVGGAIKKLGCTGTRKTCFAALTELVDEGDMTTLAVVLGEDRLKKMLGRLGA